MELEQQPIEGEVEQVVADEAEQETTVAEEAEVDGAPATPEEEPKSRSEARKAQIEAEIKTLTREKYLAQKAAEEARRQAEAANEYIQMQTGGGMPPMPTLKDVDFNEERYQQAVQQWAAEQTQRVQQQYAQSQQAAMQQQQERQRAAAVSKIMAEGQQKYPDFAAVVADPTAPSVAEANMAAFEAMMSSDMAPDVAYYLGKNPHEVYQLAEQNPVQAVRTIARIEAKLAAKPAGAAPVPPSPPSKVTGKGKPAPDPSKMTMKQYIAWRTGQSQR